MGVGNEAAMLQEAVKSEAALGRHVWCLPPKILLGRGMGGTHPSCYCPAGLGRPSSQRSTPVNVLLISTVAEATRRARMGCVH